MYHDEDMEEVKSQSKLRMIRRIILALAFAILFFGSGYQVAIWQRTGGGGVVGRFLTDPSLEQAEGADFSYFWEVWNRLEESYVDPSALDYNEMTYGSIEGLAQSLGDPYTQYLPPVTNKQSREDLEGAFYGVGIELGYKDGTLAVIAPLEGGPAKREGVLAGDLIINILDSDKDIDTDTKGMTLTEAVRNIRGEKGKPITLTLFRDERSEAFDITIIREEIVVPTVDLEYILQDGEKIAHLKLYRFGGRTDKEWLEKVGEIVANNVSGVILDLRNNPGGFLDGSIFITGEFLREGVVVQQQGRYKTETYSINRRGSLLDVPLVVLVNKGSASASEISAGALQDHGRAMIVGEVTFGKGTVQEVQELSDGSSLHVTIAKWLLPNGKWIGDGGIIPDVEIKDDLETEDVDEQVVRAVEILLN